MYFILFGLKADKKEATQLEGRRGCRGMVSGFAGKMRQDLKGRFWEIPGDRDSISS